MSAPECADSYRAALKERSAWAKCETVEVIE